MCQWTYCLLEVMCFGTPIGQLVGETAKGPKYPTEAGVSSKVKNKFFFLFFFIIINIILGRRLKDIFFFMCATMMSRNYIKTQRTEMNRTYLSCK